MPKLVAQLRVKNGIVFINRWLNRMNDLVDEIVVVDNGSDDGTFEIVSSHPKVVSIEKTEGFDEGRDRVLLYDLARKRNPDWCIHLDVDEIFEKRITREDLDEMMNSAQFTKFYFRHFNMHRDEFHFEARLDKLFEQSCWTRLMWKEMPSGYVLNRRIHVPSICGIPGKGKMTRFRIKHIGMLNHENLIKKTENYIKVDPGRASTYIKHSSQRLPTWKWYEYADNPIMVNAQMLFLDSIHPFAEVIKSVRRRILKLNKVK